MKSRIINSLLVLLSVSVIFSCGSKKNELLLPVYGAKKPNGEDTTYHSISDFSFKNQYGENVSRQTVQNKIYVADFFFASCQSICPVMSGNLKKVQSTFENDPEFLILSHSVNPLHDTVEVLKDYASTYSAKKGKWHLLTGNKKEIYDLAKNAYLVNALEDDGTPEGFLHSELFLLVDKKGRIRGMYDGTDDAQVAKLINDIKTLKKEKQ